MTKEEKSQSQLLRLLEMQEHPERFSDEEIRQLMADEECRQLYEQMVKATDALYSEKVIVTRHSIFRKVAAVFIGLLILSGISYAAYQMWNAPQALPKEESKEQMTIPLSSEKQMETPVDSTQLKPVVFEDAELAAILGEISAFYQVQTVYQKEDSKHIRLYFTWDKQSSIDDVIDTFNKFERIHITRDDKKLIVE